MQDKSKLWILLIASSLIKNALKVKSEAGKEEKMIAVQDKTGQRRPEREEVV